MLQTAMQPTINGIFYSQSLTKMCSQQFDMKHWTV